ncbi:uncharacterized protein MONOS_8602 [Monocercomonoides exilis]|uniref:uncharacterized protein n=1 Tax=Monocercomonoides exilis TaxID=2049356 RepID=UPI00355A2A34|nr:hypothetical protein MONOS_8602 [Monocercomonoides exilis]|eukprot:MONOS_8602.1-p1 / transcript=MONOS_8602.1 / gene=MONOS_8602 / organism=Monocercomonoides_exilis_PA203 / gene_product=unspecified product / transcript_product=unspecified product / location=Mono_scaffold00328:21754-27489(-) / protein_length=1752 / sequence_SO=supercontig / SO=protein_coding / is_pseudo=false
MRTIQSLTHASVRFLSLHILPTESAQILSEKDDYELFFEYLGVRRMGECDMCKKARLLGSKVEQSEEDTHFDDNDDEEKQSTFIETDRSICSENDFDVWNALRYHKHQYEIINKKRIQLCRVGGFPSIHKEPATNGLKDSKREDVATENDNASRKVAAAPQIHSNENIQTTKFASLQPQQNESCEETLISLSEIDDLKQRAVDWILKSARDCEWLEAAGKAFDELAAIKTNLRIPNKEEVKKAGAESAISNKENVFNVTFSGQSMLFHYHFNHLIQTVRHLFHLARFSFDAQENLIELCSNLLMALTLVVCESLRFWMKTRNESDSCNASSACSSAPSAPSAVSASDPTPSDSSSISTSASSGIKDSSLSSPLSQSPLCLNSDFSLFLTYSSELALTFSLINELYSTQSECSECTSNIILVSCSFILAHTSLVNNQSSHYLPFFLKSQSSFISSFTQHSPSEMPHTESFFPSLLFTSRQPTYLPPLHLNNQMTNILVTEYSGLVHYASRNIATFYSSASKESQATAFKSMFIALDCFKTHTVCHPSSAIFQKMRVMKQEAEARQRSSDEWGESFLSEKQISTPTSPHTPFKAWIAPSSKKAQEIALSMPSSSSSSLALSEEKGATSSDTTELHPIIISAPLPLFPLEETNKLSASPFAASDDSSVQTSNESNVLNQKLVSHSRIQIPLRTISTSSSFPSFTPSISSASAPSTAQPVLSYSDGCCIMSVALTPLTSHLFRVASEALFGTAFYLFHQSARTMILPFPTAVSVSWCLVLVKAILDWMPLSLKSVPLPSEIPSFFSSAQVLFDDSVDQKIKDLMKEIISTLQIAPPTKHHKKSKNATGKTVNTIASPSISRSPTASSIDIDALYDSLYRRPSSASLSSCCTQSTLSTLTTNAMGDFLDDDRDECSSGRETDGDSYASSGGDDFSADSNSGTGESSTVCFEKVSFLSNEESLTRNSTELKSFQKEKAKHSKRRRRGLKQSSKMSLFLQIRPKISAISAESTASYHELRRVVTKKSQIGDGWFLPMSVIANRRQLKKMMMEDTDGTEFSQVPAVQQPLHIQLMKSESAPFSLKAMEQLRMHTILHTDSFGIEFLFGSLFVLLDALVQVQLNTALTKQAETEAQNEDDESPLKDCGIIREETEQEQVALSVESTAKSLSLQRTKVDFDKNDSLRNSQSSESRNSIGKGSVPTNVQQKSKNMYESNACSTSSSPPPSLSPSPSSPLKKRKGIFSSKEENTAKDSYVENLGLFLASLLSSPFFSMFSIAFRSMLIYPLAAQSGLLFINSFFRLFRIWLRCFSLKVPKTLSIPFLQQKEEQENSTNISPAASASTFAVKQAAQSSTPNYIQNRKPLYQPQSTASLSLKTVQHSSLKKEDSKLKMQPHTQLSKSSIPVSSSAIKSSLQTRNTAKASGLPQIRLLPSTRLSQATSTPKAASLSISHRSEADNRHPRLSQMPSSQLKNKQDSADTNVEEDSSDDISFSEGPIESETGTETENEQYSSRTAGLAKKLKKHFVQRANKIDAFDEQRKEREVCCELLPFSLTAIDLSDSSLPIPPLQRTFRLVELLSSSPLCKPSLLQASDSEIFQSQDKHPLSPFSSTSIDCCVDASSSSSSSSSRSAVRVTPISLYLLLPSLFSYNVLLSRAHPLFFLWDSICATVMLHPSLTPLASSALTQLQLCLKSFRIIMRGDKQEKAQEKLERKAEKERKLEAQREKERKSVLNEYKKKAIERKRRMKAFEERQKQINKL